MFASWWKRADPAPLIDDRLWASVGRRSPLLRALPSDDARARLRALAEGFLARKQIVGCNGFEPNPLRNALLAAHCCLPALQLGGEWLGGWRELIVYPGEFRVRQHEEDEHGVVHEWDDELAGEAWERGPIVLSWADVLADLRMPQPGFNVIVHEIAHKLDARDGAIDGVPPLPSATRRAWLSDFQRAFDQLNAQLDRGEDTAIDAYAAHSPEEFFAVASEYHYTAPDTLAAQFPRVAAQLVGFYGPSPRRVGV